MGTPGRGALRAARSGALALCVVALSVAAHVAGDGRAPGPATALALVGAAWGPCHLLARRRLSAPVLAGALTGGQVVVHLLLAHLAAHHAAPGTMPAMEGMPATGAGSSPLPGVTMVAAHALATTALAALLARGDALLWGAGDALLALASAAPRLLRAPATAPHPPTRGPVVARGARRSPPRRPATGRSTTRRGPPAGCVA